MRTWIFWRSMHGKYYATTINEIFLWPYLIVKNYILTTPLISNNMSFELLYNLPSIQSALLYCETNQIFVVKKNPLQIVLRLAILFLPLKISYVVISNCFQTTLEFKLYRSTMPTWRNLHPWQFCWRFHLQMHAWIFWYPLHRKFSIQLTTFFQFSHTLRCFTVQ